MVVALLIFNVKIRSEVLKLPDAVPGATAPSWTNRTSKLAGLPIATLEITNCDAIAASRPMIASADLRISSALTRKKPNSPNAESPGTPTSTKTSKNVRLVSMKNPFTRSTPNRNPNSNPSAPVTLASMSKPKPGMPRSKSIGRSNCARSLPISISNPMPGFSCSMTISSMVT